jgi:hypothetical protein
VFTEILGGNQNYARLAELVGVTPTGLKSILRNPIWTGWRVLDKKRDPSKSGKYSRADGRQADRKKIDRAPNEVIRRKVIDTPLISERDFNAVQQIMDLKQARNRRSDSDYVHRFIYNGFLTCSVCGAVIHTALARRDYYVCKGRRVDHICQTRYMRREQLEQTLDELFAEKLLNPSFIEECIETLKRRSEQDQPASDVQRLEAELNTLLRKRVRVIDSFVDEIIDRTERDKRLSSIDCSIEHIKAALLRKQTEVLPDAKDLMEALAPLSEWEFWSREQKRRTLLTLIHDIRVADYQVESLGINLALFSNEESRTPAATSTTNPVNACAPRR